jgi:hypothetical protein
MTTATSPSQSCGSSPRPARRAGKRSRVVGASRQQAKVSVSAQTTDAGAEREMPAPTQEQVSWDQALGSDRASLPRPSVPRRLAEQQPRRGPASLLEAFQGSYPELRITRASG